MPAVCSTQGLCAVFGHSLTQAALVDIVTSFVTGAAIFSLCCALLLLVRCWYQRLGLQRVAACCSGLLLLLLLLGVTWSPYTRRVRTEELLLELRAADDEHLVSIAESFELRAAHADESSWRQ